MAQIDYLPAHRLRRLIKELRVCADALHKQLDDTKRQCALIEQVMREIRQQGVNLDSPASKRLLETDAQKSLREKKQRSSLKLVPSSESERPTQEAAKHDKSR